MVSNILKLSSTAVNCKEHTYMSNMSNSLKDSDLNKTAGRHVPVFFRQCAQMVHFLASASTNKRKIELTFNCEEDENKCGPCHGYISSSSHTSLLPSFSSPSVLCWLPWLVSSIPLQTSELFLRTLDTKHLLDMIQGYGHSPLLKSHKLKRIELICFPLLASTVMVSQLIRSSPSSIISSSQSTDRESHNTNTDRAHHNKKRLFSNFWTADNSASDSARAKGRTTKDVIDLCLNDLQALFLITDVGTGDDEKSGTGTGTGAGTGAPQKSSDPLLHVFDTKLLKTLTFGGDTISSPSSRSIPTSRCPVVTTRNSKSTDTNNLIPGSIETDSPFLRGDKVEDKTERRKGQNYSYLQLKLIGIMGWGLLPCYCASSISTCDRNTHISSANDSSINSSNEKRDRSATLNNFHNSSMSIGSGNPFFDVGKGAAAVKDIIQKILDYTDALVEEEGLDLGPCSSKNEGDKVLGENQEHLPVKSIPIHFCVSLLASCLTTTSTVGVKTSRCSTTSTSTSTSTLDKESGILSIKPIMAKLAAGVGPIVLSFLLKIIECHIKEELEVRGLSLESRTQDPLLSASIPCPLLASSMGVDQSWKEPEVDLGIYLACLHGKYILHGVYVFSLCIRVCIVCTCLHGMYMRALYVPVCMVCTCLYGT